MTTRNHPTTTRRRPTCRFPGHAAWTTLNAAVPALILLATLLTVPLLTGCESTPTAPAATDNDQAPTPPDPARLTVDLGFFDSGEALAKAAPDAQASKLNFVNAAVRVFAVDLVARLVLTPPIVAFGAALHGIPSRQEDGSWIWVYTCVQGEEELQIRLRGLRVDDGVEWQLRVFAPQADPPLAGEIWFEGFTSEIGDEGTWTFHDPALPGNPAVAEVLYREGVAGELLRVTCLEGEDAGDEISFRDEDPEHAIEFHDAALGQDWHIRWNEADGTGSLLVPDYNGGREACWDEHQDDVDCR